uniref:Uncharacterized protein n=1 Tax=Anopheles dirus TaxID=7168 RepID=A0A182MZ96_9DIPT
PLEERNFLASSAFIANFTEFWKHVIVCHWKELLKDNEWFNECVMLVLWFCRSTSDECVIVGSFFGTTVAQQLCDARHNLLNDLERACVTRDTPRKSSLKRRLSYLDKLCVTLFANIAEGFKFAQLSALLMERICETLESHPDLMVGEYKQLDLLATGLKWKNRKSIQTVLKCLKRLIESGTVETCKAVGLFIMRTETQLVQIMDAFKSFELAILLLFLQAQRIVGSVLFSDNSVEKIALKMFSKDEAVVNAAIDLHVIYHTALTVATELEKHALVAVLDVFERYEYPLAALDTVTQKLWIKGFFRKFNDLFAMLEDSIGRPNAAFQGNCLAHVINNCHQLLMEDIKTKVTPTAHRSESINWSCIHRRMQSFAKGFPRCLQAVSRSTSLYSLLLNCLNPVNNELYKVTNVDCEAFYTAVLFDTLAKVALDETTDYTALFHTLTSIQ